MDVNFKLDPRTNRVVLMGALDNLVKGAAGTGGTEHESAVRLPGKRGTGSGSHVPVTEAEYKERKNRMKIIDGGVTAAKGFLAAGLAGRN